MAKSIPIAALLVLCASSSLAQTDPESCASITNSTARLTCYDKSAASGWPNTPEWHGDGMQNIAPFTIDGPWTIHWSSESDIGVQIFVYTDPSMQSYADSPSSSAPGSGQSYETVTGTIYLKIGANGPWKVWVTTD